MSSYYAIAITRRAWLDFCKDAGVEKRYGIDTQVRRSSVSYHCLLRVVLLPLSPSQHLLSFCLQMVEDVFVQANSDGHEVSMLDIMVQRINKSVRLCRHVAMLSYCSAMCFLGHSSYNNRNTTMTTTLVSTRVTLLYLGVTIALAFTKRFWLCFYFCTAAQSTRTPPL